MRRCGRMATSRCRRFWKAERGGLRLRLYEKPAHVLHDMLAQKEITAAELTRDVLARLDETEGQVQAYLTVTR